MCQHPNLVALIDLFEDEDNISIVMEYLSGGDLYDYLSARKFNLGEERVR